jgi:hypothetical protein
MEEIIREILEMCKLVEEIVLKIILKKYSLTMWIGSVYPRIGIGCWIL